MNFLNLIWFMLAVMGGTHLVVESNFFGWFRLLFEKLSKIVFDNKFINILYLPIKYISKFISEMSSCYQCAGVWMGFLMGYLLINDDWKIIIFVCGPAGSLLSSYSKYLINLIEAKTIISLSDFDMEDGEK